MPERPDLRQIARDIRESLADYDRDALLEMLTHVFQEYVVDGVPPVLLGRADTLEDLAGLSFPELMRTLQTRLDHSELELFQVQDEVVLVRAGGVLTPLTTDQLSRRSPAPVALSGQTDVPGASPGPRAAADEAIARGRGDLVGGNAGPYSGQTSRPGGPNEMRTAPPPRRGLSISGRNTNAPSASAGARREAPAVAPGTRSEERPAQTSGQASEPARDPSAPPAAAASDKQPETKHPEGDDPSSIRFSLLELD